MRKHLDLAQELRMDSCVILGNGFDDSTKERSKDQKPNINKEVDRYGLCHSVLSSPPPQLLNTFFLIESAHLDPG